MNAQLDIRVYVAGKHGGSEVLRTDGTNGGTGPVSDASGNLVLEEYKVTAVPVFELVHAAAEGESRVETTPDDPLLEGDQTKLEFKLSSKVTSWATPVINRWSDFAEATSKSTATMDYISTEPVNFGTFFRFVLTWRRGRNVVADTTEHVASGYLAFDNRSITQGPWLTEPVDNNTLRMSAVFERDEIHANGPLRVSLEVSNNLAHYYPPLSSISILDPYYFDYIQSSYDDIRLRIMNEAEGTTQQLAVKPDEIRDLVYGFNNVPSGLWYDPSPAAGFLFEMLEEGLLFDRIMDFPSGYDIPFTVSVDGQELGQYGPGQAVDFVALLGSGVPAFTISGIEPYAQADERSPGFAVQLAFNEQTATFRMSALLPGAIAPGRMLSPVGVAESGMGTFSTDVPLENMINGSGLSVPFVSGETSFDLYFQGDPLWHQGSYQHYWQSNFAFDGNVTGTLDFDLGEIFSVDALGIWNGTLENVVVRASETAEGPWALVETYQLADMMPLVNLQFDPQILQFPQAVNARYIRIEVLSAHPYSSQYTFRYAIVGEVVARVSSAGTGSTQAGHPEIAVYGGKFNQVEVLSGDGMPSLQAGTEFGTVSVGRTAERSFRIANEQLRDDSVLTDDRLTISSITVDSPEFEVVSGAPEAGAAVVIQEGAEHFFTLRFSPGDAAAKEAMVNIWHNDESGDENPFTFKIRGTGAPETLEMESISLTSIDVEQAGLSIRFQTKPSTDYQLFGSLNLTQWSLVEAEWIEPPESSGEMLVRVPFSATPEGAIFFRIEGFPLEAN